MASVEKMSSWRRGFHFLAYLLWGCGTSFALASDAGVWIQSAALLPPLLFWAWNAPGRCVRELFFGRIGRLAWLAALAVLLSAALNGSSPEGVVRYLALLPAFLVLLLSAADEVLALDALRALVLSGLVFCAVHAASADWSRFLDPQYRIELFLNTNGVGFIAAMTALALLVGHSSARPRRSPAWLLLALALPLAVLFLSRSRTATSSFLAGLLAYLWARFRGIPLGTRLGLLALLAALGWFFLWQPFFEAASQYYSLFDKYRNISNATNRTEIWSFMLTKVIPENLFFGVGPGQHEALVQSALGYSSAHNGLLQYLGDVGVVGTAPYLVLLNDARRGLRGLWAAAWLPLLAGGLVESVGETMFFSIGNAGSLLFVLTVITLARRRR
jgi:O-antigen ligase